MNTGLELKDGDEDFFCEACAEAKQTVLPFPKERSGIRAKEFGELVYADVWGPAPVATRAIPNGRKVRIFRKDKGLLRVVLSNNVERFLEAEGINHRKTVHDSPKQNGSEERQHRTIAEHGRAMLFAAKLPRSLWGEAFSHAVWLKNRVSV